MQDLADREARLARLENRVEAFEASSAAHFAEEDSARSLRDEQLATLVEDVVSETVSAREEQLSGRFQQMDERMDSYREESRRAASDAAAARRAAESVALVPTSSRASPGRSPGRGADDDAWVAVEPG